MRILRFIALLLVVVVAYGAQFILHPPLLTTSSSHFPIQLSTLLPDLACLRAFVAGDLRDLALLLLAIATLTFGLLTVPWPLTTSPLATVSALFAVPATRRRQRLAWFLVIVAVVLVSSATLLVRLQSAAEATAGEALTAVGAPAFVPSMLVDLATDIPWLPELFWAGGLLLFFLGCGLFPWRFAQDELTERSASGSQAKATAVAWGRVLLLGIAAALLYGWRLLALPLLIQPDVAQVALWASDWGRQGATDLFGRTALLLEPGLYLSSLGGAVTALFFGVTQDLLLSVRLTGFLFALVTIGATWLLGMELFHRAPAQQPTGAGTVDQGQWPAFIAAILVMTTAAMLLFSRFPVFLEMVGWGCLGCWALLRGLRTGDRLAVGVSGVLLALSALLYSPGIAFLLTALCWWVGYGIVQTGWLPHHLQPTLAGSRFRGYFLLWLVGVCMTAAPTVTGHWFGQTPGPLLWQGNLALHWQPILLAFAQPGDRSHLGGLATSLFHPLLTPLLCLAVGALGFNFDRRSAWCLLTWVAAGLLCAMVLPTNAPTWPALLPVVPATGLILAFGLDRLRSTLLQSAGSWSRNLFNYLLLGLLVWIGVQNGVTYYDFAQQQVDQVSAIGYELRTMTAGQPVIVVGLPATTADTPQVRFFTNDWRRPTRTTVVFTESLPAELPNDAIVLLTPSETALATIAQLQSRYPDGTLVVRRDHRVNLLLYRYSLAPKSP